MDPSRSELIVAYLDAILEVNRHLNLTRIEDTAQARMLHIEDSLSGLPEVEAAPEGPYVDLGSGGGFPGVPLTVVSGRRALLVDSVKKKMAAVQLVVDELGIEGVSTYDGRIEDLALERGGEFAVATARALAKLSVLLELASPLLKRGGVLVCYKAQLDDEELQHALKLQAYLGMKLKSDRSFLLSDGETHRRILAFEKVKEPGLKLPRKVGFAQKRPL